MIAGLEVKHAGSLASELSVYPRRQTPFTFDSDKAAQTPSCCTKIGAHIHSSVIGIRDAPSYQR